jgi:peptidase inhibitor I78 family protein
MMKHLMLTCALLMPLALAACDNKKDDTAQNENQTSMVADVPAVAPASGTIVDTMPDTTNQAAVNTPVPADTPSMQNTPVNKQIAVGEPNPSAPGGTCGADQSWVGKTMKDVDLSQIKTPVRTLYPDSPATMDFSAERLNIILERGTDRITEVRCG